MLIDVILSDTEISMEGKRMFLQRLQKFGEIFGQMSILESL
jgi:hypothetical protein